MFKSFPYFEHIGVGFIFVIVPSLLYLAVIAILEINKLKKSKNAR